VSLPEFSVRRPVTVLMATIAVTIFGFISRGQLPVELLPDLSYPSLTVQTEYADAVPVSVEQFVTRPIEEAVGVIPGIRTMHSVSRAGISEVVLEFEWDQEMDFAVMEVRDKLGLADLPREADRPRVLRFDPSLDPIMRIALSGDRPLDEMRQVAERWIKPRLEAVRGVAAAKVRGGLDPEIQVEADEDRLAALGLSLDDLAQALNAENVNRPGGTLRDWGAVYLVRTLHEFDDLDQLRRTVVRETAAGRVRVEDVARVHRGHKDREEITRHAGREVVEIALHREGSANTLAVAAAIREALDGPPGQSDAGIRAQMAQDLSLSVLNDQSRYIAAAIGQVWSAAVLGGILAVLVLYFFLRDPVSTAIIAVTIPISVIATFLPLLKAGVTLNIMSLGGLALGVGMLVDNSIVVLEAIDRHRRQGLSRQDAARKGGSEVSGAVTAATLTTVAVFLPIVFVQGVAGQLFFDLAVTVCLALVASLFVSLTLIPMLTSVEFGGAERIPTTRLLRGYDGDVAPTGPLTFKVGPMVFPPIGGGTGITSRVATFVLFPFRLLFRALVAGLLLNGLRLLIAAAVKLILLIWWVVSWLFHAVTWPVTRTLDALGRGYPGGLRTALRMRWAILPASFGLFALAIGAIPLLGTNLVPDLSQGEFAFRLRLDEGSTLETASELVELIEQPLIATGQFERVFSVVGSLPSSASGRRTRGENLAQIDFVLPDGADPEDEQAAIERVRRVLDRFPRVEAELVHPSVLAVRPPVEINLFSDDLTALDEAAMTTALAISALPGIEDVSTTSEPGNPEITIEIDRERASALGIRADPLANSLRHQIRGEIVGQFREQEERLDIRLRASERWRGRASEVEELRFRLEGGMTVPVAAFASVVIGQGPAAIHRTDGSRVAQVTAKVNSGDLGRTLDGVRSEVGSLGLASNVVAELSGQNEELKVSYDSLKLALALAIFMVYVVMAVQFESLRYPLVILLSVPMGIVGVVAALWLTRTGISVLALIGAVMLAGIVVNNAIVLVDAINRRRRAGEAMDEAIVGAGRERLRPILMTTATTVLALLPMALGLGEGDELRRPLAITVIGGLTAASLLTLIVIPCLYRVFSGRQGGAMTVAGSEAPITAPPSTEGATP